MRKNILFIVIDQLRADCLTGALSSFVELPNLRALMREAVSFSNHYTVVCPCGPSRASMLTGLYAMNHRSVRNGTPLRDDITNVALESRKFGYEPLLFGYTDTTADPRVHHPNDPALRSYERPMKGFCEKVEMRLEESYRWRAYLKQKGYKIPDYKKFFAPRSTGIRESRVSDPAFYKAEDSDTAFLTDACVSELSVHSDQNWFTHITYLRPHPPLIAPEPYNDMYDPAKLPPINRRETMEQEAAAHPFLAADFKRDAINSMVSGYDARLYNQNPFDVQVLRSVYLGPCHRS